MTKQLLYLFLIFTSSVITAQSNTTSSTNKITDTGGSINYTIGQVFYQSQSGSTGIISNGVQVPVETLTLSINDDIFLHFTANVYPNPTVKDVYLKIDNLDNSNLSYQLYSINGKLITKTKSIIEENTKIAMSQLPVNVYLLQIKSNKKIIRTFKIIKNQ